MTAAERIREIVRSNTDMDKDSLEKLVTLAYCMGREAATRETSDKYVALIADQRKRASECRYSKFASAVIGDESYIYSPDYAGEFTALFGSDETAL